MDVGATVEQVDAVRQILESAYGPVRYYDEQMTLREAEIIFADYPDLLNGLGEGVLPTSFAIDWKPAVDIETLGLDEQPGVREVADPAAQYEGQPPIVLADVVLALWFPRHHDVLIFFDPGVSDEHRDAVLRASSELLADVVYWDLEQTIEEFGIVMGEAGSDVGRDLLPTSARGQGALDASGRQALEALPGVRELRITSTDPMLMRGIAAALSHLGESVVADGDLDRLRRAALAWAQASRGATRAAVFNSGEIEELVGAAERVASIASADCDLDVPRGAL